MLLFGHSYYLCLIYNVQVFLSFPDTHSQAILSLLISCCTPFPSPPCRYLALTLPFYSCALKTRHSFFSTVLIEDFPVIAYISPVSF